VYVWESPAFTVVGPEMDATGTAFILASFSSVSNSALAETLVEIAKTSPNPNSKLFNLFIYITPSFEISKY
jgi:hypothetical protein